MEEPQPRTFELAVGPEGAAAPGLGLVAAFVPATPATPAVIALACDPRHDPGRTIQELAPGAIGWLRAELGEAARDAIWTVIDNYGRFYRATPDFAAHAAAPDRPLDVAYAPFSKGAGIEAFYADVGAPGETSIELLTALVEQPHRLPMTPPMTEFLDAIEAHGNLPAPGLIFHKVSVAADEGDACQVANIIQPDPVISALLINYANAARFAAAGKTASVPQAVTRLGTRFVKNVVFVVDMLTRYQHGACPEFDYRGFWLNAIATGASMRALLPEYGVSAARADEAFTTGVVAGIGWLAVAETFPALMTRYLERCRGADPVTKARAQRKVFRCEIGKVSERYLQRYAFPESVIAAVGGRSDVDPQWSEILSRAIRIGQALAPFECLAIPATLPVPDACRAEWANWQPFIASIR
jgi:HD-like signal output (HDOD) protein